MPVSCHSIADLSRRARSAVDLYQVYPIMKYFAVALLVACFAALAASQKPLSLETIDLDSTLKNDKLVRRYIDCVLEKGRCDNNGKELKEFIPQVLKAKCADCSPKVKSNTERIIEFMKKNHAAEWTQINKKYSA